MSSSGNIPSRQPIEIPSAPDTPLTALVLGNSCCLTVSLGAFSPVAFAPDSMASPRPRPHTSEIRFPNPAAAIVVSPSANPSEASIASPARIMMRLSANPNPINGTAENAASCQSCPFVGGGTNAPAAFDSMYGLRTKRCAIADGFALPATNEALLAPLAALLLAANDALPAPLAALLLAAAAAPTLSRREARLSRRAPPPPLAGRHPWRRRAGCCCCCCSSRGSKPVGLPGSKSGRDQLRGGANP
mmetsp:Transcript_11304/g.26834  ORF Transcript_11304/g.26834 Transcript_11304/m.26834 type:complete len:246 (-) Transcript_11304:325-1062(-)